MLIASDQRLMNSVILQLTARLILFLNRRLRAKTLKTSKLLNLSLLLLAVPIIVSFHHMMKQQYTWVAVSVVLLSPSFSLNHIENTNVSIFLKIVLILLSRPFISGFIKIWIISVLFWILFVTDFTIWIIAPISPIYFSLMG